MTTKNFIRVLKSVTHQTASLKPCGGRSLTIPHQAVNIRLSLERFTAPSIEERLQGYYEEQGLEMPDFDRMDKIERLQRLADARAALETTRANARKAVQDYETAKAKAAADAAANNPIPSQSNTNTNENGK